MPTYNASSVDIQNRLRAEAEVPDDVMFTVTVGPRGRLTVGTTELGGPFEGDYQFVKMRLETAVERRRARQRLADDTKR